MRYLLPDRRSIPLVLTRPQFRPNIGHLTHPRHRLINMSGFLGLPVRRWTRVAPRSAQARLRNSMPVRVPSTR